MKKVLIILGFLVAGTIIYDSLGKDDIEETVIEKKAELKRESSEKQFDQIILNIPNESNKYFEKAVRTYTEGDMQASAVEIRNGAKTLRKGLVSRMLEERFLNAEIENLKTLAGDVLKGHVDDRDRLKFAFAKAQGMVAYLNLLQGRTYLSESAPDMAISHIIATVEWVENIALKLERELHPSVSDHLTQIRQEIKQWDQDNGYSLTTLSQKMDSLEQYLAPEDVLQVAPHHWIFK